MARIHVEVPDTSFKQLKQIKIKVGDPDWKTLITMAILEYGEIRAGGMYCTGWAEGKHAFTEDGKMVINIPECLAELLDAETYYLGSKNPPRWKVLRLQAVFYGFAWFLAHADDLRHNWDHTGEYLAREILEAFNEIGLKWEQAKSHISLILSSLYSMYPWLWGNKLASTIGKKVLEKLEKKYPNIKARWARWDEDTVQERQTYARMAGLVAGHYGIEKVMPKLCIDGVSVVAEWEDEQGKQSLCLTFVD